ncbi:MAG: hypothetical protein LBJ08_07070 [Bifidobacteriaceae bacterium]|jgi:hypothetical protein|nr:hypothetical protein [Bifidobacteriaceae bacterium]
MILKQSFRLRRRDDGFALVTVLGTLSFLLIIVMISLSFVTASTKNSRYAQDADRALSAAASGLDDLLTELRIDPEYLTHVQDTKDEPESYCKKLATGGPVAEGDVFASVCGWDPTMDASFQPTATADEEYHYAITYVAPLNASLEITATGKSGDVYRTVQARLTRENPSMWAYIVDYELIKPNDSLYWGARTDKYGPDQLTSEECGAGWASGASLPNLRYAWEDPIHDRTFVNSAGNSQACGQRSIDGVFNGPVHFNDTLLATSDRSTIFQEQFTTANTACQSASSDDYTTWAACTIGDAAPAEAGGAFQYAQWAPQYRSVLELPTVEAPKNEALAGTGCLYQGPTRIILYETYMRVWSKETSAEALALRNCGSVGELSSEAGAAVSYPPDGLVFVDAAQGVSPVKIQPGQIGGRTTDRDPLPLGVAYAGSDPAPGASYVEEIAMTSKDMFDGIGNLWVEGVFTGGQLTLGADGSVIVTSEILTRDHQSDLIGLIAGGDVMIYNPVCQTVTANAAGTAWLPPVKATSRIDPANWPKSYGGLGTSGILIEAAIYAAGGSFGLQQYITSLAFPRVEVFGSVGERFSGILHGSQIKGWSAGIGGATAVGQRWNASLARGGPPYFPVITNGEWQVVFESKTDVPAEVSD